MTTAYPRGLDMHGEIRVSQKSSSCMRMELRGNAWELREVHTPSPPPANLHDNHRSFLLQDSYERQARGGSICVVNMQIVPGDSCSIWSQMLETNITGTGTSTVGCHLSPGTSSLRCAGGTEGPAEGSHPRGRERKRDGVDEGTSGRDRGGRWEAW